MPVVAPLVYEMPPVLSITVSGSALRPTAFTPNSAPSRATGLLIETLPEYVPAQT